MTSSSTPAAWTAGALSRFGAASEIEISTRRADGSLRAFVPVWIVAVSDALYVRSYRGAGGACYRDATAHPADPIRAAEEQSDVAFNAADPQQGDAQGAIDDTYRSKYGRYGDSYLQPMLAGQAVAATLRLVTQS